MNQGLRGDGAGEDVDGDWPPPDERSVGDDNGDDFPLPEHYKKIHFRDDSCLSQQVTFSVMHVHP